MTGQTPAAHVGHPDKALDEPTHSGASSEITRTLIEEHAVLLREVQSRCREVTTETDAAHWPGLQLHRLLDYLHVEVLQQVVDEEWLLFRTWHHAPQDVALLRDQHFALRQRIEALTAAAADTTPSVPTELATLSADLLTDLQEHFRTEEALTAEATATSALAMARHGSRPHEWYAYTAGTVIDLDNVPGRQGADAVLGRLLRLARGESIQLTASSDPRPLWHRLAGSHPDGYGFTYLEQGPTRWRVEITRRNPAD